MSGKAKNEKGGRDPRCARTVQFSRMEFELLRIAAERAGTTRSAVIRAATQGLLRALAEQLAAKKPAATDRAKQTRAQRSRRVGTRRLDRCPHPPESWVRERGVPPYCRLCARPVCARCRVRWRIWGLNVAPNDRGVGVFDRSCRCQRKQG